MKDVAHTKFVLAGDPIMKVKEKDKGEAIDTVRVFIFLNCSYQPANCPNDSYILHKITYVQASTSDPNNISPPSENMEVLGPKYTDYTFRLLAGNKALAMGVAVDDELIRIQTNGDELKFTKWSSDYPREFSPRFISFMNAGDGMAIVMDNGTSFVAAAGGIKNCKPPEPEE